MDARLERKKFMPARSNIFQRLVLEIHKELWPGWTVTESRELTDSVTGEPREVDIVAEAVVEGYSLLMCIEVRDRGRPADVPWLEGIAKKHEHLPTRMLIAWSATGFFKPCLQKAKALKIDLITPESIDKAPWATVARSLISSSVKWVQPELTPWADVVLEDGAVERWECQRETVLTQVDGNQRIPVGAVLDQVSWHPESPRVFLDHAPEGSGDFYAIYQAPFPCTVEGPDGAVGKLNRLVIGIRTRCEIAPVVTKFALHGGTVTTLAEAKLSDGMLQFVSREKEAAPPPISVNHEESQAKKRSRKASPKSKKKK
jgi:hypothetical protein